MKIDQVRVGVKCTYFPPKENVDDNRHFPVVVEAVGNRVRARVFMAGAEDGVIRNVSAKRLEVQYELL
ncbi:MAG: hypothetical protein IDH49_08055 [Gammaproteobacteria bacterium]|nr:hypothetical protein [Gammaproteobacteria bacterium]